MKYEVGPAGHPDVTRAALRAADDAIDWQMATGVRGAVLAFLEYMADNYVGDYYVEGSLAHLRSMVRELEQ